MTEKKATRNTPVKLKADFWDHEGTRQNKGEVIKVSKDEAARLIKAEAAERTDPLPE